MRRFDSDPRLQFVSWTPSRTSQSARRELPLKASLDDGLGQNSGTILEELRTRGVARAFANHTVVFMNARYRVFQLKSGVSYLFELRTESPVQFKDQRQGSRSRILHARNEAVRRPRVNLHIARAYLAATDDKLNLRTWGDALRAITETKQRSTKER